MKSQVIPTIHIITPKTFLFEDLSVLVLSYYTRLHNPKVAGGGFQHMEGLSPLKDEVIRTENVFKSN